MKKLLFFLLLVSCIKSFAQNRQDSCVIGSIYRGDTLFSFNPCTGEMRQITKFVLPYTGEGVKMYLSVGSTRYWAPIDSMMWVYFTPSNYLAISDSASMLSKYLRKTDTTGKWSASGHVHDWTSITGKPSIFTPSSHTHVKADITDFPTISGTNTGDNAVNSLYSSLVTNATHTGDATGSVALTLATVNSNVGSFGSATQVGTYTVNGKGLVTAASNTAIQIATSQVTGYTGYSINVQATTSSPTDAQTIYFGNLPKAPVTAAGTSKIYIRQSGTIKRAEIYCYSGTAGTNEAWPISIRLNNNSDTQIGSLSVSTKERVWSNTGLNIAVNSGDYIEIKSVNPTWATNPLTTIFGGYIYIE